MLTRHVALVADTKNISASELTKVGAALSKQASRDFGHIWNIRCNVHAFAKLEDVPLGYWPVIIRDDIMEPGAAGFHSDDNGAPFALVQFDSGWSVTASHEVLEMLGDPSGNRTVAGPSLKKGQGRVEYLVEVCDPSEAVQYGYTVNGIPVSDFYTPNFFDPMKAGGVRYSFTGAITAPRQVLADGYLSWRDPITDHWFQLTMFGRKKKIGDLGKATAAFKSAREFIDFHTPTPLEKKGMLKASPMVRAAHSTAEQTAESTSASAGALRAKLESILHRKS